MTNTPVTNTTTGSVSSDRAGMASGMSGTLRFSGIVLGFATLGALLYTVTAADLSRRLPPGLAVEHWRFARQGAAALPLQPIPGARLARPAGGSRRPIS